jgi:hypothetical protein
MDSIFRNFWLLALVITGINTLIYQRRIQVLTREHPERAEGYQHFLIGFVAVNAVVWLVMGVGIMIGGVPTIFASFHLASGNPFVLVMIIHTPGDLHTPEVVKAVRENDTI